jgi:hypothetical protein
VQLASVCFDHASVARDPIVPFPSQTLYKHMKDGGSVVSARRETDAASEDSDDDDAHGEPAEPKDWREAFQTLRSSSTGMTRLAEHQYGGDLFSQRGNYQEGERSAAQSPNGWSPRPHPYPHGWRLAILRGVPFHSCFARAGIICASRRPRAESAEGAGSSKAQASGAGGAAEDQELGPDILAPGEDEAAMAFEALRHSSTLALARLARKPRMRCEIAASAHALQTLFDTWRTAEDETVRFNCALGLSRVFGTYRMPHDDMMLPVLSLCVPKHGVAVLTSAARALAHRLTEPGRPIDVVFLPAAMSSVHAVLSHADTTARMRRFCADILHGLVVNCRYIADIDGAAAEEYVVEADPQAVADVEAAAAADADAAAEGVARGSVDLSSLVVELKGRVACEIQSGHALVLTEMIFEGVLAPLEPEEVAALLCALICQEKGGEGMAVIDHLPPTLADACQRTIDIARAVGQAQRACGLEGDEEAFVESCLNFSLSEAVLEWAQGTSFETITGIVPRIQEGSIVRTITRLDNTCREVRGAARIIGDPQLFKKADAASAAIKRDIVFAASLYVS